MTDKRREIRASLSAMEEKRNKEAESLTDSCLVTDYQTLTTAVLQGLCWTKALEKALEEHAAVVIPASDTTYYLDRSVAIPSHRKIVAYGATVSLLPETDVLMFRNEHVTDGALAPEGMPEDEDISFLGGTYVECRTKRGGCGATGKYDEAHSKYGVSTCFLFSGVRGFTLKDVTFSHTAGFALQAGNLQDAVFENIAFESCYADGLHINGNSENVVCRNIRGQVGDDLVALNAFDWDNSSINFGPIKNVLCEHLDLYRDSNYKALRILPGIYYYGDGSFVDCATENILFSDVRGIKNFKLYLQTRSYPVDGKPSLTGIGTGDHIYFENIDADLDSPIDGLPNYRASDPLTGWIALFEIGADIGGILLENINLTVHPEYPSSAVLLVGPKSSVQNGNEVFDPYVRCTLGELVLHNVKVNGTPITTPDSIYLHEVRFDRLYNSPLASGAGKLGKVTVE
ncbi:MAG TPA: right-handed parallel beta-helix repeat-containing protein [Oscillospiraceae bacterium]|nr:right-handed parallel beta-helix repeat-containing protein [Oscillospiraceae bacterium]HPF55498.1 right-handed parallel beta-helix repeat-containing protein [Clostridiales bacterium]HPK34780.1 right-handed parallel beta-helix repeat-containing protein [Oscillospiraceae bacterium]HPR76120.1 right-handed parallel beta-helix repeat-containing protein [Oscillospiraceae bacterium]